MPQSARVTVSTYRVFEPYILPQKKMSRLSLVVLFIRLQLVCIRIGSEVRTVYSTKRAQLFHEDESLSHGCFASPI